MHQRGSNSLIVTSFTDRCIESVDRDKPEPNSLAESVLKFPFETKNAGREGAGAVTE